jgi:hypothetical protein
VVENDGNVHVNISVYSQSNNGLWLRSYAGLNTTYFQSRADNTTEKGSFYWPSSLQDWTNIMNSTYKVLHIVDLNYEDTNDTAQIELRVRVPSDESPGVKTATLVFEATET